MALYRLGTILLIGATGLSGCGGQKPEGRSELTPVVEVLPETKATADVDARATLALKQVLLTNFPQNSPSALVETGLKKEGYECSPNPAAPSERACLKVVKEGACEINTIIRSTPYAPEKAQIIRICAVAPPLPSSN